MNQAQTQIAKTFGAIAFASGMKCVPALDANISTLLTGRQVGDKRTMKELKAWISGWTQANIAAQH